MRLCTGLRTGEDLVRAGGFTQSSGSPVLISFGSITLQGSPTCGILTMHEMRILLE
jgi:hypothetical protein